MVMQMFVIVPLELLLEERLVKAEVGHLTGSSQTTDRFVVIVTEDLMWLAATVERPAIDMIEVTVGLKVSIMVVVVVGRKAVVMTVVAFMMIEMMAVLVLRPL